MRGKSRSSSSEPIEFKGTTLAVVSALLRSADPAVLAAALEKRLGHAPDFFSGDMALLDLTGIQPAPERVDWPELLALLRRYNLSPVAARVEEGLAGGANAAGLAVITDASPRPLPPADIEEPPAEPAPPPSPAPQAAPQAPAAPVESPRTQTLILDRPLRSGQQVYARGADLVVLAMVSAGAEVIADGSIHVYAPLRGRALAGARGDPDARIFCTSFEAELVSVAGVYRTFEQGVPSDVARKPAHIRLAVQGERQSMVIEPLQIA
ncbi:MAG: septum site-determining protein MinC [Rhodocyclaceae bacterium]|nr:septum site-determining protein MinC [Rhodocyclaceae bacterium]